MGSTVYVGNLSWDTTEDDLRNAFSADGRTVKKVTILADRVSGKSRGFGFIEMETEEEAKAAITALNGTVIHDRPLKVNDARERSTRSSARVPGRSNRRAPW